MCEIIQFQTKGYQKTKNLDTIIKIIDGVPIECVCLDDLSPEEQRRYLDQGPR